ncbi:MAG: aminotransferase class I/II-fold pyridoxal phosphate-dependent enzyme [Spirochaetales bacterium]|nr:aminotransferase class I/II-fold pyridoxal phosphate-dependent enzyme [Spirochaetales bacterium]
MNIEKKGFSSDEWICAHYGDEYADQKGSVSTPIFQSSTYIFDTCDDMQARRGVMRPQPGERTYFYSRDGNPTVEVLEKKLAALERTEGCNCFGSGMAAITSVMMYCLKQGDHAIVVDHSYGRNFLMNFLHEYGVETTSITGTSINEFEDAIRPNTRLIYLESPSGALYSLQDLAAVSELARSKDILTAIDNTWATPINQKPHTFGIDFVIHSLSKYIGGHSDIVGGAVTGTWELIQGTAKVRSMYGGILHPQEAYLALRGLRTLPVRMKAHGVTGRAIAEYLDNKPEVEKVNYPGLESHPQHELARRQMLGFSSLMSMSVNSTIEKMRAFVDELQLFKIAVSWGGYESLIIEPRPDPNNKKLCHVRLFVGQDNLDDLLEDFEHSFSLL